MNAMALKKNNWKPRRKSPESWADKLISLTTWRLEMNDKTQAQNIDSEIQQEATVTNPYHILLAEDDMEMRALLALSLRKAGYRVTQCRDGVALLTHLAPYLLPNEIGDKDVGLIISDIRMPGFTGMEVLEGIPKSKGFPPMILITAFGDEKTHALAKEFGAAAMFDKPFDMDDLLAKAHELLPPNEISRGQSRATKNYDLGEADIGKTR